MTPRALALWVLLAGASATAAEATPQASPSLFDDEAGFRYGRHRLVEGLVKRTLLDLVAIPASVGRWSETDLMAAFVVTAQALTLSAPLQPSLDYRFQDWLQRALGEHHFTFWTQAGDLAIWATLGTSLAGLFAYGLLAHDDGAVEASVLAVEAFVVAQVYVNFLKLLTGRSGPKDEVAPGARVGPGDYHGPAGFVRYWPSGTPSGHLATAWALFGTVMTYYDTPWLTALLSAVGLFMTVTVVTDDYHYLSESLLGAVMGYCIGRWVVHHRSTRFSSLGGTAGSVTVAPAVTPGQAGLAVSVRF